jgi:hypothetical protein
MSDGFIDGRLAGVVGLDLVGGVCFANRPILDCDGNARSCEVTIEVDFDDGAAGEWEVLEEGRPPECFREWFIPSEIVNSRPRRVLNSSERDELE